MPRKSIGERSDEDLAWPGRRLQALRDIHRVAGDRIGSGGADAEPAGDDGSCVDAYVQNQRRADARTPALPNAMSPTDHVLRALQRALGIVFMRDRGAEQGEQRIADELVDKAAKVLNRRGQRLEQFVLERLHHLWIEPFAQSGEAAEIGE